MRHVKGLNNCQHTERFIETFFLSLSLSLARNLNLIPVVEDLQEVDEQVDDIQVDVQRRKDVVVIPDRVLAAPLLGPRGG